MSNALNEQLYVGPLVNFSKSKLLHCLLSAGLISSAVTGAVSGIFKSASKYGAVSFISSLEDFITQYSKKRWRLYILPQYLANQTKPTKVYGTIWFNGSRSYTNSIALVEFE